MIAPSSSQSHTDSILWALPVGQMDWERTPPAVRDYIDNLHQQIKDLEKPDSTEFSGLAAQVRIDSLPRSGFAG